MTHAGSLRKLTEKAAFKIKFDEFVDDQSFHGLRRLTFNNMVEDPSFIAERLAYDVFRAVGLPAPRCNSALVRVNGMDYGVYANVETEDKTYDRSDLRALIAAIDTSSASTFGAAVGVELDMTHFLRFTAAEAAVNQWDMYAYTLFYPNNFRLYRDPTIGKFVFLPWGMDMAMKPFRDTHRPFIGVFDLARAGDRPDAAISAGVIFRLCMESPECATSYAQAVEEIVERYDALELPALAARYYEQIKTLVYMDPRKEYSDEDFENGYQSLLDTVRGRSAAMRAELQD